MKIMMLGASQLQVPAIKTLKKLGHQVIVVDYNKNAIGFPLADIRLLVSTIDQDEVYKQALKYQPDVIMTSTSDAPVKTVAYVNEKLGKRLDISYEDAICATNKAFMRKRLKSFNIPIPIFYVANSYNDFKDSLSNFKDLCIIKPADNAGSRGVRLIDVRDASINLEEAYEITKRFSRTGVVMVEEYMIGKEVSVESMTINGQTVVLAITDKMVTPEPIFVEIGHSVQSRISEDVKNEIEKITKDAVRAINIINGPSHTEIKITPQGPKIVEIAARLGGDFITSKLVPLSTGINMVSNSVLLAIGEPIDLIKRCNLGSSIRFLFANSGIIKSVEIDNSIENIKEIDEIKFYKNVGDYINTLESSDDRIGHIITKGETVQKAVEAAEQALSKIKITVK
jgi:biotin carboxylase